MTFDEYVSYIGTPENLQREGSGGPRIDRERLLPRRRSRSRG